MPFLLGCLQKLLTFYGHQQALAAHLCRGALSAVGGWEPAPWEQRGRSPAPGADQVSEFCAKSGSQGIVGSTHLRSAILGGKQTARSLLDPFVTPACDYVCQADKQTLVSLWKIATSAHLAALGKHRQ